MVSTMLLPHRETSPLTVASMQGLFKFHICTPPCRPPTFKASSMLKPRFRRVCEAQRRRPGRVPVPVLLVSKVCQYSVALASENILMMRVCHLHITGQLQSGGVQKQMILISEEDLEARIDARVRIREAAITGGFSLHKRKREITVPRPTRVSHPAI